jgi:hypothetical protein
VENLDRCSIQNIVNRTGYGGLLGGARNEALAVVEHNETPPKSRLLPAPFAGTFRLEVFSSVLANVRARLARHCCVPNRFCRQAFRYTGKLSLQEQCK